MIPILFDETATDFTTQGLGALTDAITCTVCEERNGSYELEMKYPITGVHFENIAYRSIICAIPSPYRSKQPFRVYKIVRNLNGTVMVYAQHISYDLSSVVMVGNLSATSLVDVLTKIKNAYYIGSVDFDFWTDISSDVKYNRFEPCTYRKLLGGMDGSILDVYGGEYEFDGHTVKLWKSRGSDNNVAIRYRKNLTALDAEFDGTDCADGVFVYWADADGTTLAFGVSKRNTDPYAKWVVRDVSDQYESRPTAATLDTLAASLLGNCDQSPIPSIKVSFVDLAATSDYADVAALEALDLCDTVHVYYGDLLVDERRKVTSIRTNVLEGRYEEITIGKTRASLSNTN